MIVINIK